MIGFEESRYTVAEINLHEPRACPGCGRRVSQSWVDVTCLGDPEPMFRMGRWWCRWPGCPQPHRPEWL